MQKSSKKNDYQNPCDLIRFMMDCGKKGGMPHPGTPHFTVPLGASEYSIFTNFLKDPECMNDYIKQDITTVEDLITEHSNNTLKTKLEKSTFFLNYDAIITKVKSLDLKEKIYTGYKHDRYELAIPGRNIFDKSDSSPSPYIFVKNIIYDTEQKIRDTFENFYKIETVFSIENKYKYELIGYNIHTGDVGTKFIEGQYNVCIKHENNWHLLTNNKSDIYNYPPTKSIKDGQPYILLYKRTNDKNDKSSLIEPKPINDVNRSYATSIL